MSKLYNTYVSLKANNPDDKDTLYLFKSGIFFICIDNDAIKASSILNLKLTNLNNEIYKCGFPVQSLEKYSNILKLNNCKFKLIDLESNTSFSLNSYTANSATNNLLSKLSKIDTDSLSIKEAYSLLDEIKEESNYILGGLSVNGN